MLLNFETICFYFKLMKEVKYEEWVKFLPWCYLFEHLFIYFFFCFVPLTFQNSYYLRKVISVSITWFSLLKEKKNKFFSMQSNDRCFVNCQCLVGIECNQSITKSANSQMLFYTCVLFYFCLDFSRYYKSPGGIAIFYFTPFYTDLVSNVL